MIRRLRRKFVLLTMGSLLLVLVVLITAINLVNLYQVNEKADSLLTILLEHDGKFPVEPKDGKPLDEKPQSKPEGLKHITEETPFETRYFVVRADLDGEISQIDTGHVAAISSSQAQELAEKAISSSKTSSFFLPYKYIKAEQNGALLLIFVDCSSEVQSLMSFLWTSLAVAAACMLVMFCLVSVLSRRAVRPVLETMEKQKQFITDAGHEIKTPLAIISANADVLELTAGENEWITSIRNQTVRLDELVKNLLSLSRMEEQNTQEFQDFSFSDAVSQSAQAFRALAEGQGKTLEIQTAPRIRLHGNETAVRQMVAILMDNAVKYASEGGTVRILLYSNGKSRILAVENTFAGSPPTDFNRWFDRFYRSDSSRTRETGGYGIGLSIAQAIVELHHGRIAATFADGNVRVIVTL